MSILPLFQTHDELTRPFGNAVNIRSVVAGAPGAEVLGSMAGGRFEPMRLRRRELGLRPVKASRTAQGRAGATLAGARLPRGVENRVFLGFSIPVAPGIDEVPEFTVPVDVCPWGPWRSRRIPRPYCL